METLSVRKREPLTPGQRKKRTKRILIGLAVVIASAVLIRIGADYALKYYIRPRASQKEAYALAQQAIGQGDTEAAIQALSHAGAHEALGSAFLSPRGGVGAYEDADELRHSLSLELMKNASVGDIVYWGQYEQDNDFLNGREALAWRVVAQEGDVLTLISLCGIDCIPYENAYLPVKWAGSTLREWLNKNFYPGAFSDTEKELIRQRRNTDAANPVYGTQGGVDTNDWAYVPSIDEVLAWFADDADRVAQSTAYAKAWGANYREESCWWWLRSPGDDAYRKAIVHNDGSIYYSGYTVTLSSTATVRPVINIDLGRLSKG